MTSVSATSSNVTKWLRTRQRNGVGPACLAHSERTQLKETTSKRPPLPSPLLPWGGEGGEQWFGKWVEIVSGFNILAAWKFTTAPCSTWLANSLTSSQTTSRSPNRSATG